MDTDSPQTPEPQPPVTITIDGEDRTLPTLYQAACFLIMHMPLEAVNRTRSACQREIERRRVNETISE